MYKYSFILLFFSLLAHSFENPKIYGNATVYSNLSDNSQELKIGLENEMYIGFKGASQLNDATNLLYQFESGFLGEDGAKIGNRNSFVALIFNQVHSLKAGRLTTGLYDIIDWPFSHILGNLADWSHAAPNMGMYDRNGNTIRYDYIVNNLNFSFSYGPQDSARNNFFDSSLIISHFGFNYYLGRQVKNEVSSDNIKQRTTTSLIGIEKSFSIHKVYAAIKNTAISNSTSAYNDDETDGAVEIEKRDDYKQNTLIAAYTLNHNNKFSTKLAIAKKMDFSLNNKKVKGTKAYEVSFQETFSLGVKTLLFARIIYVKNSDLTKYLAYKNGEEGKRLYLGISHDF